METSVLPNLDAQLAAAKSIASWDDLAGDVLNDIFQAITESLANPVGFPSLDTAIIPDDKVCLAMESDLPQKTAVMEAIVEYLLAHGTLARNISILVAGHAGSPDNSCTQFAVDSTILQQVEILTHDPSARQQLAYLAANTAGDPIYINRALIDADVVIPICVAKGDAGDWRSQVEFIFPAFSDEETINRFQKTSVDHSKADDPLLKEAEDAIRWLGVYLSVQIEPGPNRTVLGITTGERNAAIKQGHQHAHRSWHRTLNSRCQLIVASLSDRGRPYTWSELLSIIVRFSKVLKKGGSLVIRARLGGKTSSGKLKHPPKLSRQEKASFEDLLNKFHIYLLSDLHRDKVESLGFAYIESNQEINHLAQRVERCLVIADADCSLVSI